MTNEEMIIKIKKDWDMELFNDFFVKNRGFVMSFFNKWKNHPMFSDDNENLLGEIDFYFAEAFHKYEINSEAKFTTYAYRHISGRIKNYVRDNSHQRTSEYRFISLDATIKEDSTTVLHEVLIVPNIIEPDMNTEHNEEPKKITSSPNKTTRKQKHVTEDDRNLLRKIREMIETKAPFILTLNGISKTIEEWSEESGIPVNVIKMRLRKNWETDRLLSPVQKSKKKTPK